MWLPVGESLWLNAMDPWWTSTMVETCGAQLPAYRPIPIEQMPRHAVRAALTSEDQKFFTHDGFDWDAIEKAWDAYGKKTGHSLRGGSTISQQVARNVFLWQGRNWVRKGLEAWFTVWLELLVPKDRILEVYLNVAEMGPCTFGLEAAAQHWYGRPASGLEPLESASIIAMLPAPDRRTPTSPVVVKHAQWIVANRYQPPVALGAR